jgi:hypothetical protein
VLFQEAVCNDHLFFWSVQISPHSSTNFTLIFPILFFSLLFCDSIDNVCLSCVASSPSHASLCSHSSTRFSLMFLKLIIANTKSKISNLMIYSLGKPWKSYPSRSSKSSIHDWTSVIGFMEDTAWDMLHIKSNTATCFPYIIMLSSSLVIVQRRSPLQCCFMDAIIRSLPHNLSLMM